MFFVMTLIKIKFLILIIWNNLFNYLDKKRINKCIKFFNLINFITYYINVYMDKLKKIMNHHFHSTDIYYFSYSIVEFIYYYFFYIYPLFKLLIFIKYEKANLIDLYTKIILDKLTP